MKELQRYELHDIPDQGRSVMAGHKSGSWCDAHEAISALEAAAARGAELKQLRMDALRKAMAHAESQEATIAELRARVAALEGMVPKPDPLRVLAYMDDKYGCDDDSHDDEACVRCRAGRLVSSLSDERHETLRHDTELNDALNAIAALPAAPKEEV